MIIELDADNKVIGGEWVGGGRTRHPDFKRTAACEAAGEVPGVRDT